MGDTMKVYELAKELDLDSITLLDKLKDMKIVVKSHMSALSEDQVDTARTSLAPKAAKKGGAKKAKKKSAIIRKKTSSGETKVKTTGQARFIRKKTKSADAAAEEATPKKKVTRRKKAEEPAAEEEVAAESPASTSKTSAPAPSGPVLTRAKEEKPKSLLKIVKSAPAKKTQPGASAGQQQDSDSQKDKPRRIIKMNKESLDKMVADETAKKRTGVRENLRPEDANFSDYRKKEMIFLPRRKRIPVGKELRKTQKTERSDRKKVVQMGDTITVQELSGQLGVRVGELMKKLIGMGQMITVNQPIDFDTASLLATEYKWEVKNIAFKEEALLTEETKDDEKDLVVRPPIVTIMGHVDHGKTTLLDSLRDTNVVAGESGGITQHIGAYTITRGKHRVTFIDTPGHEAFTTMRARGANITDIVVLVVAADDGVMPQTREAISHAKDAGVPIIVAVNKIDAQGANIEKIKQALAELDLLAEDWGGQTMYFPVSALKKQGLDELLEGIVLNAEVLELKSNPGARAEGRVLEAKLEKGRGPVLSLLVTRGTLKRGDSVVAGPYGGRVRAMTDATGKNLQELTPGMAAEVLGFEGVPEAGESFSQTKNEADARRIIQHREEQIRAQAAATKKMSLDDLFSKMAAGDVKELKVILKSDVFGTAEAIKESLEKAATEKAKVNVIHTGTGGITERDVMLASASSAIILGFHVRPETKARKLAEKENVEVKTYTVIYELVDDVKNAMRGLLDKKKIEKFLGRAEVRQTFSVPKIGIIAGSSVIDGKITRNASIRLLRDNVVVFEGEMTSLKRFKNDAKEVATGYECGIGIHGFNDIKPGDVIEAYEIEMVSQEL